MGIEKKLQRPYFNLRGMTLVELLLAMAIAAVILSGVLQLYASSVQNNRVVLSSSIIQENARFAFSLLERDLIQAGAGGCFSMTSAETRQRMVNALKINTGKNNEFDFSRAVLGQDDVGKNGSDRLTVRFFDHKQRILITAYGGDNSGVLRLDTADKDYWSLKQGDIVYIANCARAAVFMLTNVPAGDGVINFSTHSAAPANHAMNPGQENSTLDLKFGDRFVVDENTLDSNMANGSLAYLYAGDSRVIYKIDNSANANSLGGTCTGSQPQYCALFRNNEELVEGVHQFDVLYGWQDGNEVLRYGDWAAVNNAGAELSIDRIQISLAFNSLDHVAKSITQSPMVKQITRVFMLRNQLPVY
ncbi:PilW family protein [Agaribacterium haliotis]|uniref:PilW family protein n=1 Tax=Agaribacterium haliotis TaxID=2013869 RepID=UPI000BB5701D|nr:prepilin-type N-terminal cleavage/methylation domain-containing protein [Agaribacterium haliotis]